MVQINFGQREVSCKVVFYGPGMSGKTTNLEIIHKKAPKDAVGEMVSIATETDRTLYFDFLPLDMGTVKGFKVRFHLYTVPGQVFYDASRKLILRGCDGVIFVADSQTARMEANIESIANLATNLKENGFDIRTIPYVLQLNKRDMPTAAPVTEMEQLLRFRNEPMIEAVASRGIGVIDTLKATARQILMDLQRG